MKFGSERRARSWMGMDKQEWPAFLCGFGIRALFCVEMCRAIIEPSSSSIPPSARFISYLSSVFGHREVIPGKARKDI